MSEEGRILTCVYCGWEYPQDTPTFGDKALTDHIKICTKRPMRKLESEKALLTQAVMKLVLCKDLKDVEKTKKNIKNLPSCKEKSAVTFALDALLKTSK